MATNFDKALYEAPQGLDQLGAQEVPLEIEIEDPEAVQIGIDGQPILRIEKAQEGEDFYMNLAEEMSEQELMKIAGDLIGDYDTDVASRKDWVQTYVDGLELLGMKLEERSEPWEGACGVYHPLLAESVVKFQAETMMETFPAAGPVKSKIIGKETPEKKKAAERVQEDMNYQLTEVMVEYRPEHERLLWGLGLAGNAFKKVYFDLSLDRQVAMYVPAEDVVVPYGASSLEAAERVTHVMRKTENDVRRLQHEGFYLDVDLGEPQQVLDEVEKKIAERLGFRATEDNRFKILEMHVDLDLPGFEHEDDGEKTGIALPYVVTIEKGTQRILAIRRNWREDDETYQKRQHFVHYPYIPGFGFYAFGLIHLIGAFAKSGTSILRQLVDAGTLSNLPGGFKTRGLRTKGDDTPISPGEFRDVDVPSGSMRDNIMPLPYKEPSQVLAQLMQGIIDEGRRFAGTMDLQISDMGSAAAPVGTTLAVLERTLKTMSAVQARIHYAMKQEFKLLKELIRDNTQPDYSYEPDTGDRAVKQSDYDQVDVIPVSDPNAATMAQKVVQYQAALQLAQTAPNLYDLPLLHRQMLEVLGIKNYQKLVPIQDDMKPCDPVTENMDLLRQKPVKAFLAQDHRAHIAVHMALAQDPHVLQLIGQNPQLAQQLQAAGSAHIAEHLAMEYRKQMEQAMGITLPPYEDSADERQELPPQAEAQIAQMAAQASQQLLQQHQQEAQQAKAQQQAQDPLIQLQQQELQIKQGDLQRKMQKDQMDQQAKMAQLAIEQARIAAQKEMEQAKLVSKQESEGFKAAVDMSHRRTDHDRRQESEGFKTMADLRKLDAQHRHQMQQARMQEQRRVAPPAKAKNK